MEMYHEGIMKNGLNYRRLVELSPASIGVHREGKWIYINPAGVQFFGASRAEDILGKSIFNFIHPDDHDTIKKRIHKQSEKHPLSPMIEEKLLKLDGTVFNAEVAGMHIMYEGRPAAMILALDITDRKLVEKQTALQIRKMTALRQSLESLNRADSTDDVYRFAVRGAMKVLDCKRASILTFGPDGKVHFDAWHHLSESYRKAVDGHCPWQQHEINAEPICMPDIKKADLPEALRAVILNEGIHAAAFFPLVACDHLLGKYMTYFDGPHEFSEEEINFGKILAVDLVTALNRIDNIEKLHLSKQRLRKMIEVNPVPTIITRLSNGQLKYANHPALDMMGVSLKKAIGKRTPDYFVHSQERNLLMKELTATGNIQSREILLKKTDGEPFWALASLSLLTLDNEPSVMATIYDITERKQNELNLRIKQDQLQALLKASTKINSMLDNTSIGKVLVEAATRLVQARSGAFGMKENGCMVFREYFCGGQWHAIDYTFESGNGVPGHVMQTGKPYLSNDAQHDKHVIPEIRQALGFHQLVSVPITSSSGEVLGCFEIHDTLDEKLFDDGDIELLEGLAASAAIALENARLFSEREQTEKTITKLSQAVTHSGASIMLTDKDGIIEYVNPSFEKMTGYKAEDVIGHTPGILKSGKQNAAFYEDMWHTITHGNVWHSKVIDKKKGGEIFPAMLTIAPITNENGEITHLVGSHADISELENMEQQFHQAQKMEALGTLVGGIAHDFNNMLAGMTGNLYLAKQKLRNHPEAIRNLDNIEKLSRRAADMIQQLLAFARKGMVNMKETPLVPFVKETIKFLRASVPESIHLHQYICSDALTVRADATQIHQVLMNLVNNACDATQGVDEPRIFIRLKAFETDEAFMKGHAYFKPGRYAYLSVQDNGCGIPGTQIKTVFEPFFTTKAVGKGTGLGLSMVFGAIKTHHGFIDVESIEGEGTTFHIYIPLLSREEDGAAPADSAQKTAAGGHGELILLADDEDQVRETTASVLETLGYRVLQARDGLEALELFKAHRHGIALALLDVVMPHCNGPKLARSLRQINPDIKIIFATGYDKNLQADIVHETALSKPFHIEDLSQLIREQLDTN